MRPAGGLRQAVTGDARHHDAGPVPRAIWQPGVGALLFAAHHVFHGHDDGGSIQSRRIGHENRLGWDDHSRNYREIARALEDNGASLIAVHGRTKVQAYSGAADWDAVAIHVRPVKWTTEGFGAA